LPAPHSAHVDEVVARATALNVPAAHEAQSDSAVPPVVERYLPALQAGQVLDVAFLYRPVGQ